MQKSDEGFKKLFEYATTAIVFINSKGAIELINPSAEKLFGYTPDELQGQSIELLFPESLRSKFSEYKEHYFNDPLSRQQESGLELTVRQKPGTMLSVRIKLTHYTSDSEKVLIVLFTDLSKEKQLQEKFAKIFYKSPAAKTITEIDTGKIIDVNESFCRLTDYSKEELIGKTSLEIGFYSTAKQRETLIERLKTDGRIENFELTSKTKTKENIHLLFSTEPIDIENKRCLLNTCIDITEKKRITEKLIADEKRIRTLIERTPAAVAMLDAKLNYIAVSNRWMKDYHIEGKNIIGENHYNVLSTMPAEWKEYYERCLAGETIHKEEDKISYEDGTADWLKWELCPWYATDHEVGGIIIFSEIVTAQKELIEALKASKSRYAKQAKDLATLSEAANQLWRTDNLHDGLEEMLSYALQLFGTPKGNVQLYDSKGKVFNVVASRGLSNGFLEYFQKMREECGSVSARALKEKRQLVVKDLEEDQSYGVFRQIARQEGFRGALSTPLFAKDGSAIGLICIYFENPCKVDPVQLRMIELYAHKAESFIEQIKINDTLKDLNQSLELKVKERTAELTALLEREKGLNELKSRFVAMASHEFRTPLTMILSSVELLEMYYQENQPEKREKHVKRIKSSIKNLVDILNDFLSLEKLEQHKVEVARNSFNLKEFSEDIIEDVRPMLKPGQHIGFSYTGKTEIIQDKKILKNVLINLFSNAIKYSSEQKEITFSIEVNSEVIIKIKDEGIGIPDEEQKNLFTKFFRAKNATHFQGTGLGLSIVKRYMELLNGNITFTSKSNAGSTFIVMLPNG